MRNERSDVAQLVMLETQAEVTLFSKSQRIMNAPEPYEIRVAGHLSTSWAARYERLPGNDMTTLL
jgi:hypothetical protein